MAKMSGSALGQFRNKFGNAVTAMWQSINVARIYQPIVSNPRTEKQQQVRARFAALASLAKQFRAVLLVGLRKYARSLTSTSYGTFIQLNWDTVDVGSDPVTINYAELQLSHGGTQKPVVTATNWGSETHLKVFVDYEYPIINGVTSANDEVYLVIMDKTEERVAISTPGFADAGSVEIVLDESWNGRTAAAFMFVISRVPTSDGLASDTVYVGSGEVQ